MPESQAVVVLAMDRYELYEMLATAINVLWVLAFGACIGSLINVLVYRLPLGLNVVTPSSRCPSCETKLTWRENIPILGWLLLRGRCRFCRSPVSPEYPIVETFVALLWVLVFLTLYSPPGRLLGINFHAIEPEWAANGFRQTWPTFLVVLTLLSCLVAATLIDARTFTIPMSLTWTPAIVAVVVHPLHAAWIEATAFGGRLARTAPGEVWTMATPGVQGWWWIGGAIGGAVGLGISTALMALGLIRPSFADFETWEREEKEKAAVAAAAKAADGGDTAATTESPPTDLWVQYPHARREMLRELIFVGPCVGLGLLGSSIAYHLAGPWSHVPNSLKQVPAIDAPLWLVALAAVLMGYIIGGGVVWAMRIFGSLAFGKEALGMGDVHLMAAVGACLGWIDSVLGFFGAAFVGVAWAILGLIFSGAFKRAMPFGPFLAIATVLVWFGKPLVEQLLTLLTRSQIPINLP